MEQQKDEPLNEKSETEDGPSQPSINQPAVSTREPRRKFKMSRRYCRPTPSTSFLPGRVRYYTPLVERPRKSIFLIHMVYKIWRSVEALVLRTEYRRRKSRKRKTWLAYRITWFIDHLIHPKKAPYRIIPPYFRRLRQLQQSRFWYYLRLPFYYLRLPFYYILDILLSFMYCFVRFFLPNSLYFVVCFPLIVWVRIRHRDVLVDRETRARQQEESIRMLGNLPYIVNDYDEI